MGWVRVNHVVLKEFFVNLICEIFDCDVDCDSKL